MDLGPFEHLPARYLAPARPHEREAREAVRGARTPELAWETLFARGLLPAQFVLDAALRRFGARGRCAAPECATRAWSAPYAGSSCPRCAGCALRTSPTPPRLTSAIAVASDAAAMLTVEALVREYAARSAAWGADVGPRCVWAELDPWHTDLAQPRRYTPLERLFGAWEAWYATETPLPYPSEGYTARAEFRVAVLVGLAKQRGLLAPDAEDRAANNRPAWARFPIVAGGEHAPFELLWETLWDARRYRSLSLRAVRVGEVLAVLQRAVAPATRAFASEPALVARSDARFGELPDPYEPLCTIYDLGYQVLCAGPAGVCVLTPPLSTRAWRRRNRAP